jgi:hypothetical protein
MDFTAYIDESDTHGPAPDMVMSAMLSTAGRWERCSRALTRIQRDFGFTIFHATEFQALRGAFEGWPLEKCFDLLMEFGQLGATHLTECFTISLSYETDETYFLDRRPRKMHRISQYGICFLGILDGPIRTVMSHGPQSKLSVVVEDGHKNAKDTARIFEDRKQRLDKAGIDLLRPHSLQKGELPAPAIGRHNGARSHSRQACYKIRDGSRFLKEKRARAGFGTARVVDIRDNAGLRRTLDLRT